MAPAIYEEQLQGKSQTSPAALGLSMLSEDRLFRAFSCQMLKQVFIGHIPTKMFQACDLETFSQGWQRTSLSLGESSTTVEVSVAKHGKPRVAQ